MAELRPSPVDRLLAGYLLLSAATLLFPHRPAVWPILLLVHLVLGGLLLAGGMARARVRAEGRTVAEFLVAWYPLLILPFLYWELPQLIGSVRGEHFFDGAVMAWEAALFGHQPSATMALRWSSRAVSETLHLAYLSYYPVIYVFPAVLYFHGRRDPFEDTLFALMLAFTLSYAMFMAFPVQGPRYLFPAPGGAAADGPIYALTHAILEAGSSRGAAFPSAHAAVAAVQTINAMRHLPPAAPVLAVLTVGIAVGAVYGGFHYAVDMLAGIALGVAAGTAAPAVRRALS